MPSQEAADSGLVTGKDAAWPTSDGKKFLYGEVVGTKFLASAIARFTDKIEPLTVNHQGQFPSVTLSFNGPPGHALGEEVSAIQAAEADLHIPITLLGTFQGTGRPLEHPEHHVDDEDRPHRRSTWRPSWPAPLEAFSISRKSAAVSSTLIARAMESRSRVDNPVPADGETGDPFYAFRRSLGGAQREFTLRRDAIEWRAGFGAGRLMYADVRRVRLSFRTLKLASDRFITEIWPASGPKLTISSTSWKSLAEQESFDKAYAAFIVELHRRLTQARSTASFEAGSPGWLYWPSLAIFLATSLAIAALGMQAIRSGETFGALFVTAFLALYVWRIGIQLKRNRPGTYRPDALPPLLVPHQ
jgi:hypothetical protein